LHELIFKAPFLNPKTAKDVLAHENFRQEDFEKAGILDENEREQLATDKETWVAVATMYEQAKKVQCSGLAAGMAVCENARTEFFRAQMLQGQGQSDAALAAYSKAVDLLDKDRGRLRDERGRGLFLEDKIGFYYPPILQLLSRQRHAEAFDLLERSRSRALADLLLSRELTLAEPKDRALYAQLLGLRAEIAQLQRKLPEVRSFGVTGANRDKAINLEREIQALEDRHSAVIAKIMASAPKLRELAVATPASLKQLQEMAARGNFDVLQYLLLEDGMVVWWIGANGSQARNVFLPRSAAAAKVKALRESIQRRPGSPETVFDEEMARQLFLFLIQPVLQYIQSNSRTISSSYRTTPCINFHFRCCSIPMANSLVRSSGSVTCRVRLFSLA
jgi:tetratricopeptide (TPR) repeat protein